MIPNTVFKFVGDVCVFIVLSRYTLYYLYRGVIYFFGTICLTISVFICPLSLFDVVLRCIDSCLCLVLGV